MDAPQFDIAQRQQWMAVLAHSEPQELASRWEALKLNPSYQVIRQPETGLVQIQARMGATGQRFFAGDATLTRAVVQLDDGIYGYSYLSGRDKAHAERCAVIDALMQDKAYFQTLQETLIAPLAANREQRLAKRRAEVNSSRVDFFTLVRGDNA
ncbi:phosphonate C-P lyase system protein PhnG [Enterobacter sp. R1(2018)]|uniref:phosphonate C-P lyase system protein PhnG n=1 Tax=Enterobacter sp. R1(2018) TaxID=2447891 RepID=UPI000EAFC6E0|nr:phosphonate C-P lyase system protein PhnG [Enterobacter sp. R1(2018)]RKQ40247.1 phosphonate C-P lyase system protein PhnG [Enterobacter sp. R1(2018)]